ncbi:MAG: TlpA family protein disulfide reductase [Deltaproteobacteria bacterium]|nr:TlpA family protein disulfide reductase [Deltaproteobacteria bacterium]
MSEARLLLVGLLLASLGCASATGKAGRDHSPHRTGVRDFALRDLRGQTVRLSDHAGKVVLLSFWATWCGPCQTELSQLQTIWKRLRERGFELLTIAIDPADTESEVRRMARRYGYEFPVLLDQETEVANRFNPTMDLPYSVLLDRRGAIAARHQGFKPGDEKIVEEEILRLLGR